jgi:hypothetical protein
VTAPEPQRIIQQLALLYGMCTDQRAKAVGDVFNYVAAFHPDFSVGSSDSDVVGVEKTGSIRILSRSREQVN